MICNKCILDVWRPVIGRTMRQINKVAMQFGDTLIAVPRPKANHFLSLEHVFDPEAIRHVAGNCPVMSEQCHSLPPLVQVTMCISSG